MEPSSATVVLGVPPMPPEKHYWARFTGGSSLHLFGEAPLAEQTTGSQVSALSLKVMYPGETLAIQHHNWSRLGTNLFSIVWCIFEPEMIVLKSRDSFSYLKNTPSLILYYPKFQWQGRNQMQTNAFCFFF